QRLATSDPTKIVIPAYTLGYPGSAYRFRSSATLQETAINSSALVQVAVEQGVLRAFIGGGSFRQHTAGVDLVLDGSQSVDEDDIAELSLRYTWACVSNCSSISNTSTSDDGQTFTVAGESLVSGLVYEFALNVSTENSSEVYGNYRSDIATTAVKV
ncbi:unnamed protein product, partial [Sphacelaria rigidula]